MFGVSGIFDKSLFQSNRNFINKLPNDTQFKEKKINFENFKINYLNKEKKKISHIIKEKTLFILLGEVEHDKKYETNTYASKILFDHYSSGNLNKFINKNGNYIFLICDQKKIIVGKSKNSIIPFYYRIIDNKMIFSHNIQNVIINSNLDPSFNLNKIGQLILTNGIVLDEETTINNINYVLNGELIEFDSRKKISSVENYFTYKPEYKSINYHLNNVSENLRYALRKLDKNMNYNVGLSGGLDSRILLSFLKSEKFKFNTHIYGMKNFDESIIARQIKKILNHEHLNIIIKQNDYILDIKNSSNLSNYICNLTTFPQRKIYKYLSKKFKNNIFLFGSALDCTAGDAWQNEEIKKIKSKKELLEYYRKKHIFKFDSKTFSNFFIDKKLGKNIYEDSYEKLKKVINKIKSNNSFDLTSSFHFETRGKRWYNNSLIYPLYYCKLKSPFYDHDFLDSLSKVPSNLRENDLFRVKLLEKINKKLSSVIYNKSMKPANLTYPNNKIMIKKAEQLENIKFIKWKKSKFKEKFSSSRYDANFREWILSNTKISNFLSRFFLKRNNVLKNYLHINQFLKIKKTLLNNTKHLKLILIFLSVSTYCSNLKKYFKIRNV
jgi:hypothetical protein